MAAVDLVGGANDDTGRVDLVDDAGAPRRDRRAGIAGTIASMPVPTSGGVGTHQRHRLALHVRAHQGAVGVVVLEERDQRRGDRDELLGRNVHEVDAVGRQQHGVAGVTADDQVAGERPPRRSAIRPGRPSISAPPSPTGRRRRRSPCCRARDG